MPSPSPTPTQVPTRTEPQIDPSTSPHYWPERLCPQQRSDGEKWSRP